MSTPAATRPPDFSAVHRALQRQVDGELLAGVSHAVLRGRELIDSACFGWADREQRTALRPDHLFRAFSNTKLATSIAVLLLLDEGRLGLDDPIEHYLPQLAHRRVLKPGAATLDDTVPAERSISIRHLLTHGAGLGYGLFDPGTLLFKAYVQAGVRNPSTPLAAMMDALAPLPLAFQPGTAWQYSVATDVLGRLVEVLGGQAFDVFLQQRLFGPLGMVDTGFHVPPAQQHRLAAYYRGADADNPLVPGLTRLENAPYPGAYLQPPVRLSGGGGLVSTLADQTALVRSLLPGGPTLLKPATLALMMQDQLPAAVEIGFPQTGTVAGKGFGLGGAVTRQPLPVDPPASVGEFQWGGMAGTHWWISPATGLSGLLMTQRLMGFWQPFAFEFKQLVYRAAAAA